MTTIYLVRHAEAEGNLYRRIHGWYDALITDNGLRQIKALEARFRDIPVDAVYSSDLYRTMTTARAVYLPKGLSLRTDPGLREMHLGDWEDMTWGAARQFHRDELERFNVTDPSWQAPGGENFHQLGERMEKAVRAIAARHPGRTIALFSHGMAIRQFLGRVKEIAPEDWHAMPHGDNTAVSRLTFDEARFSIQFEMDNSHLPEEISTLARQAWWRGDKAKTADINLWFRPADRDRDRALYPGEDAPQNMTAAMSGDRAVGLFCTDPERYREENAGYIRFLSLLPEDRGRGLGIQLVGEAISNYRNAGRDRLRLPCPTDNEGAQRFFRRHGFIKIGREDGADLLEKYIGYER